MRECFKHGVDVRWNIPDGGRARIVQCLGEGWYEVCTVPEQRLMIAKEEEILLVYEWDRKYVKSVFGQDSGEGI